MDEFNMELAGGILISKEDYAKIGKLLEGIKVKEFDEGFCFYPENIKDINKVFSALYSVKNS